MIDFLEDGWPEYMIFLAVDNIMFGYYSVLNLIGVIASLNIMSLVIRGVF
jgi:hypothetical protein